MTRSSRFDVAGPSAIVSMIESHLARQHLASRVTHLERRRSPYASTAHLEEIDAQLDDGVVLRLIFKDLRPASALPGARQVRPPDLCHPAREPLVYARLLEPLRLGARCLSAQADVEEGRCHVLLERVDGLQLCHVGDFALWAAAARWLGRLHVRLRESALDASARGEVPLLTYDAAFYREWVRRAGEHVTAREHEGARRAAFSQLAERYEAIIATLTAQPPTFIHGECYPSNIVVRDSAPAGSSVGTAAAVQPAADQPSSGTTNKAELKLGPTDDSRTAARKVGPADTGTAGRKVGPTDAFGPAVERICAVDWEMAAIGPAAFDLAALTSGRWSADERRTLLSCYLDEVRRAGAAAPAVDRFEHAVDCCRLQLAVQLLAWRPGWAPPRDHARDWLGEALALAGRLLGL